MDLKINKSLILLVLLLTIGVASAIVVNIDGSGLTPLSWFNSNKTVWDAKGNASYPLDISNATGIAPNSTLPLSAMNQSATWVQGIGVTKESNNTYTVPAQPYFRKFFQYEGVAVVGTWIWATDVSQTNYQSLRGDGAGDWQNTTGVINNEYKWNDVYLTPGIYNLTVVYHVTTGGGIAEWMWGSQSLGTYDTYGSETYNVVNVIQFTVSSTGKNDLRVRSTTKNAGSVAYRIWFSRVELEKTG